MFSTFARHTGVFLFVAAAAAASLLPSAATAQAAPSSPPPLEAFFGASPFSGAVLSPSARHLAVTMTAKDNRRGL